MKKTAILLLVLCLSGTSAFAQFGKNLVKAGVNARNLERIVAKAGQHSTIGRAVVSVPTKVVSSGYVVLTVRAIPTEITPANASFASLVHKIGDGSFASGKLLEERAGWVANEWGNVGPHGAPSKGKGFYEDQTALAKDLDNFYHGQAEVMIGPDGREVKLYTLPVDGILYQPVGYITPLVLLSDEYFVIYDIASQTGKLAENTPEIYGMFKNRPLPVLAAPKQVPATVTPKQQYEATRAHFANPEVREANREAWQAASLRTEVNNPRQLAQTLASFSTFLPAKVKDVVFGGIYKVYELPVDGLVFKTNEMDFSLNPQTTVLIFNEQDNIAQFLDREILEDSQFYEFVPQ